MSFSTSPPTPLLTSRKLLRRGENTPKHETPPLSVRDERQGEGGGGEGLPLQSRRDDALNVGLLGKEEEDQHRQGDNGSGCHQQAPLSAMSSEK